LKTFENINGGIIDIFIDEAYIDSNPSILQ